MAFIMKYIILSIFSFLIFNAPSFAQDNAAEDIQTVLIAKQQADIASPVSGRITELSFFEGDTFEQGQMLASYDCLIQTAQRDQAKARYEAASGLLEARKKLSELNTVSKLELLRAQAEARQAGAEVKEYEARISRCTVLAPFDGRITARHANPHETTEAGQPLMSIASMDKLQAKLLVPSNWLSWIKVGSALEIEIQETSQRYNASILRIGGAVDPVSQSIQLIAELDNDHPELLPGMTGLAHIAPPVQ